MLNQTAPSLVRRAAEGDVTAWQMLVDTLAPHLVAAAGVRELDAADTESLCDVVWHRLADALPYLGNDDLRVWVDTTATAEAHRLGRWRVWSDEYASGAESDERRSAGPLVGRLSPTVARRQGQR